MSILYANSVPHYKHIKISNLSNSLGLKSDICVGLADDFV
jgi:hypothetical protein